MTDRQTDGLIVKFHFQLVLKSRYNFTLSEWLTKLGNSGRASQGIKSNVALFASHTLSLVNIFGAAS